MVALGVVAGKENEINRAHKNPQHKIPLWKSVQHIYETPEILRSIFSTDSCLQSDNGVSTSNILPVLLIAQQTLALAHYVLPVLLAQRALALVQYVLPVLFIAQQTLALVQYVLPVLLAQQTLALVQYVLPVLLIAQQILTLVQYVLPVLA